MAIRGAGKTITISKRGRVTSVTPTKKKSSKSEQEKKVAAFEQAVRGATRDVLTKQAALGRAVGKTVQIVTPGGSLITTRKSSSGGRGSTPRSPKPSATIQMTDPRAGTTSIQRLDINTNQTISRQQRNATNQELAQARQQVRLATAEQFKAQPKQRLFTGVGTTETQIKRTTTKKPDITPVKGAKIGFDIKGKEKIIRGIAGEKLVETPLGITVQKKDGTFRPLTKTEQKELAATGISLNPVNAVTGFFGVAKDIGQFIVSPNKSGKAKEIAMTVVTNPSGVIDSMITQAITNPFGFAGEAAAFGTAGKIVKAGLVKPVQTIKKVNTSQLTKINSKIAALENKGITTKQRGLEARELRLLLEERKIINADLKDLNKVLQTTQKPIKTKTQVTKVKSEVTTAQKSFRGRAQKRVKIIENREALKILFGETKKRVVLKVKKGLPQSKTEIVKLLEGAQATSGQAFKTLKKKIKKERNLNVKFRKGKIVLLEPKELKIIPKKKKVKTIVLEPTPKKVKLQQKDKLTKKELKDLEFKEGQNLDKVQNDIARIAKKREFFTNKKAQSNVSMTVRRNFTRAKTTFKQAKVKANEFRQTYKRNIQKANKIKDVNKRRNKVSEINKNARAQRTKIAQDLKKAQSNLKSLKKLSSQIKTLLPALKSEMVQSQAQAQALESQLDNIQAQVNETIQPIERPTPTKPKPGVRPRQVPKKKPLPKKVPVKPRTIRPRPTPKPIEKPKTIKIPRFGSLPTTKATRQGYLIKIKKGNQVIGFTEKALPLSRAKNLARTFTDKTIGASHSITKKGRTNIKDVTKTILKQKFRPKKSKNPKVQLEVEKRKFRLDKTKEKAGIKLAKRFKSKPKKAQIKKKVKKASKKTTKKKK